MSEITERLDAITARLEAATPGPWKADTGTSGDCVVWGPNGRFLMNMQAEPHWIEYPGETRMVSFDVDKRDAEFIADARTDVAYLLDLARKQAGALEAVAGVIDEWEMNAGPGTWAADVLGPQKVSVAFAVASIRDALAVTQ